MENQSEAQDIYTKIDGGQGIEKIGDDLFSIFTTEITPKYKKIDGKFIALSQEEMNTQESSKYNAYLEATIELLIASEKKITLCKKPSNVITGNNQNERLSQIGSEEAKKWTELNDIILKTRGNPIESAKYRPTMQRSGNCSVFSPLLTFAAIMGMDEKSGIVKRAGLDIGMDFLQQVKTYKPNNIIHKFSELIEGLEEHEEAKDVMSAAKSNAQYKDRDPIEYAIDNNIRLMGLHPIEWALIENTKLHQGQKSGNELTIAGDSPLIYGLKNSSNILLFDDWIHGGTFLENYVIQRLQPMKEMLAEVSKVNNDPHQFFYDLFLRSHGYDITRVGTLYKSVLKNENILLLSKSSPFMEMLTTLSLDISHIAYEMKKMNISKSDMEILKKHCDLSGKLRIDHIIEAMNHPITDPGNIDQKISLGVQDIPTRVQEAKILDEITQYITDSSSVYKKASEYRNALKAHPGYQMNTDTQNLLKLITYAYQKSSETYQMLFTTLNNAEYNKSVIAYHGLTSKLAHSLAERSEKLDTALAQIKH